MNGWFRSWHGAPTDIKYLTIARQAGVTPVLVSAVMWALLDHASAAEDRGSIRGFDIETYCAFAGCEERDVQAIIDALTGKGVISQNMRLAQWERRQPAREDSGSSERVRRFRERKKSTGNEPGSEPDKPLNNKSNRNPSSGNGPSRTVTHRNAVKRNETHGNGASHFETPDKIREEQNREDKTPGRRPDPVRAHAYVREDGAGAPRVGADAPEVWGDFLDLFKEVYGSNAEPRAGSFLLGFPGGLHQATHMLRVATSKRSPQGWLAALIQRGVKRVPEDPFVAAFANLEAWDEANANASDECHPLCETSGRLLSGPIQH